MPDDNTPDIDPEDERVEVYHPDLEPDQSGKPIFMSRAYLESGGAAKGWVEKKDEPEPSRSRRPAPPAVTPEV